MSLNTSTSDVPSLTRTGASEPGATSSILRPRDLGHMRLQRNKKGPRSTPKHTRYALAFGHARPTQVSVGSFSHDGLNMERYYRFGSFPSTGTANSSQRWRRRADTSHASARTSTT